MKTSVELVARLRYLRERKQRLSARRHDLTLKLSWYDNNLIAINDQIKAAANALVATIKHEAALKEIVNGKEADVTV
jgi:hypothetical protein